MKRRTMLLWLALPGFVLTSLVSFASDNALTFHYYERPPFHSMDAGGHVTGLTADPAVKAMEKAGIAIHWQLTPANRILTILKSNTSMDCSPGWYKNPERETYAQFSLPIYQDKPLVGLSRADFRAPEGITAKELFSLPGTRLLAKQNFSQGAYMDALIAKMPPAHVTRVAEEVSTMVKMLRADRADLIVTTEEETSFYIQQSGFQEKEFRVLKFPDVPAVEKRYIICSKRVPAEMVVRINQAIRENVKLTTRP